MHQKVFDFIKGHRKFMSCLLVIVGVTGTILPQSFFKLPMVDSNRIAGIELMLYCSQITSALFVIVGTVIAVWQYYLSSSTRMSEVEFSRVEKAIELSNYYKDNILDRYSFVKGVFVLCGITEMLEKKRGNCELKEFDVLELEEIYTKEEIERFEKLPQNEMFINAIIQVSYSYNIEVKGYTKSFKVTDDDGEEVMEISANPKEVYNYFFKNFISETLNNAEYFAMSFTHNTADESVIYQSICPTFLEMCFVMYYYIARNSDPKEFKLYTNIADLYCMWRKRQQEQRVEQKKGQRIGAKKPGTVFECER